MNVDQTYKLVLGYEGENEVQSVTFDYSPWAEDFGEGTLFVFVKRNGDDYRYPVTTTVDGHEATWVASNVDTAVLGEGEVTLKYTVGTAVKKDGIIPFLVLKDGGEEGEVPDPWESWVEEMAEIGEEVQQNAESADASAESAEEYKNMAQTSAQSAASSAEKVAQDKDAVAADVLIVQGYTESAGASATAAAGSAEAAASKVTEASGYADAASTSAGAASGSAEAASGSAGAAAESAEAAEASAEAAARSAESAENRVYGVGLSLQVTDGIAILTY